RLAILLEISIQSTVSSTSKISASDILQSLILFYYNRFEPVAHFNFIVKLFLHLVLLYLQKLVMLPLNYNYNLKFL
ncbi:MAG: hypothetical protein ACTSRP_12670, partial [Candidatus Helarchaeota archaeon]